MLQEELFRMLGLVLVLISCSNQDHESLSALFLNCLCQAGITPWSFSLAFHKTIPLLLFLYKVHIPWINWCPKTLEVGGKGGSPQYSNDHAETHTASLSQVANQSLLIPLCSQINFGYFTTFAVCVLGSFRSKAWEAKVQLYTWTESDQKTTLCKH